MQIIDLSPKGGEAIRQVASLLIEGFKETAPDSWPDMTSALQEVQESFQADRVSRIAVDDGGGVVGWIGGIRQYEGKVWEVHPLVVRPDRQGRGIGRALVADMEEQARERGGLTIWAGSDDIAGLTSLAGVDLFPNPLEHLSRIRNLRRHPYEFYLKNGFTIVGVMPDANGPGKPDIFLAKSLWRR